MAYFQKGFGLKAEVKQLLTGTYRSATLEIVRRLGGDVTAAGIRIRLARELGFCYGVDRAVDYAYQTRHRFPDRRIVLAGEIIHNPEVNARLQGLGIEILSNTSDPHVRYAEVSADDVVILPAFGVTAAEMCHLQAIRCVLVDTTCGSVLSVWNKVSRCARDGFTVIIHGKHQHEETRATASQALLYPDGHYLCVRDLAEAGIVCGFLRGTVSASTVRERFADASSPGFDPERHLQRIGLANQTTMLMSETLAVQAMLHEAMLERVGADRLDGCFRTFDTICSATQDRQDAVRELLEAGGLDLMIVIGGYNSSNTQALARMCAARVPTFHIDAAACVERDWVAPSPISVGITAGASTPDSVVGDVIDRILSVRGARAESLVATQLVA